MSARDDLRAAVERLADEFHGATLGTDFYGNPLSGWVPVARLRTLLAEHPAPEPLRKPWCLCDPGFGPHDADCPAIAETPEPPSGGEVTADELAEAFHDAYEAAAVREGWETQERSRKPWAEVPEANKATMRATLAAILDRYDVRRRP